ncbi:Shikimate O-hydroxycinnamoyltransferase [Nymphaea thermarum]|nr:Shikimate O-hydroxycinnamoyltransferase [Nymphaea thermarum]
MVAMEVKHLNTTWVKPETRLHGKIPLTIFDRASADLHIASILVYDAPTASNTKIKLALAKALTYYPVLAGKLSGQPPVVVLDDEAGAPVSEMSVEGNLEDFLPFKPTPELSMLHPYTQETNPLLMIQLTRFACGGLVLGLCANHVVADGQSMSNFYVTWSQLIMEKEVSSIPTHSRSVLRPRDPPMPEYPHQDMEFSMSPPSDDQPPEFYEGAIENVQVHYSYDFIMKLKERLETKHSTFECLLSHLWKKVTAARGLDDQVITRARVSVNGRPRLGVSGDYFGNLVLTAFPAAKVKDLVQEDVGYGARLIKEAVGQTGSEYFQSFLDFGELNKDKELYPSAVPGSLSTDLEVDSWLGFQFHQVDMGGGAPRLFMPSWIPIEGLAIITPTPTPEKAAGPSDRWRSGVDIIVTLLPEHAAAFEKIAHSID